MGKHKQALSRQQRNLKQALRSLLGEAPFEPLETVLIQASISGKISYSEAENLAGHEVDEVLLLACNLRLLVPERSANDSLNWSDALLLCRPGEIYRMPNLSRHLVVLSGATGRWDPEQAVAAVFQEMGEPDWALMPALVRSLCEKSSCYRVNAFTIDAICHDAGLGDKVGPIILELKGAGVISPKFDSFSEIRSSNSPVYEINRALFPGPDAPKSGTSTSITGKKIYHLGR
jgi:hypothetical protein